MILGALIFILAGVVAMRQGWPSVKESLASKHWAIAHGEILSSELIKENAVSDGITFETKVGYTFQVDGVNYSGNAIKHGVSSSLLKQAEKIITPYPVGKHVNVFYDPRDPSVCVLEKGTNFDTMGRGFLP